MKSDLDRTIDQFATLSLIHILIPVDCGWRFVAASLPRKTGASLERTVSSLANKTGRPFAASSDGRIAGLETLVRACCKGW